VKKENKKIEGGEITQKPVFKPLPGEKFGHLAPGQPFQNQPWPIDKAILKRFEN